MEDSRKICPKEAREILMKEYQIIAQHFVHWDNFFWTKAQFFIAVEGVFLGAVISKLSESLATPPNGDNLIPMFCLLLAVALLNLFLCWVWFLIGNRNRLYLNLRTHRAIAIETHELMSMWDDATASDAPLIRIHIDDRAKLNEVAIKRASSRRWEIHIPTVFAVAWLTLLGAGFWILGDKWMFGVELTFAGVVATCVIGVLVRVGSCIGSLLWKLGQWNTETPSRPK
jgi:hypothetical protein